MQTWVSLIISQHDMMGSRTNQPPGHPFPRQPHPGRPIGFHQISSNQTTLKSLQHWQHSSSSSSSSVTQGVRRSAGRRPAKSAFMFLFALMFISHNVGKSCSADSFRNLWKPFSYQRNAHFIISIIRFQQWETNGAWRCHKPPPSSLNHQTTHFNINGSIICSWHHHFWTSISHDFSSLIVELCVLTKIKIIS